MHTTSRSNDSKSTTSSAPGRMNATAGPSAKRRKATAHFFRHFLEMMIAMIAGMIVLGLAYGQLMGALGYADPIESFPRLSVLVASVNMSVPMVAWMRHRGHSWYTSLEMAAGMFAPTVVLLVLFQAGTIPALALNHLPHALMIPSMLAVMLIRRREYTCHAGIGRNTQVAVVEVTA